MRGAIITTLKDTAKANRAHARMLSSSLRKRFADNAIAKVTVEAVDRESATLVAEQTIRATLDVLMFLLSTVQGRALYQVPRD